MQPSAWKRNSRKLVCSGVHGSSHEAVSTVLIPILGYRCRHHMWYYEWIFAPMNIGVLSRDWVSPSS